MKNKWIILCCLVLFAISAFYLEQAEFFGEIKNSIQKQEVPGGILDYGSMGKILKQTGLIQTVVNDDEYFPYKEQSLIRISLETNVASNLGIYWAQKKQPYSQKRYISIPVIAGKNEYALVIPTLNKIHSLRIDPISEHGEVTISHITIEQLGLNNILLSYKTGLKYLVPLTGVSDVRLTSKGLSFTSVSLDPQFELYLANIKSIENIAFPRKRQKTNYQYAPNPGRLEDFPSSKVVKEQFFKKGWPIVSVVLDKDDLYHPDKGIIPNKTSRGRYWERPAYFSYYDENGRLAFASMVGMRIHGGKRVQLYSSFRLYFRKKYGISRFTEFQPEIKFSSNSVPLKRLIVHHTAWPPGGWVFNNPLAYDISRRIGCVVPETKLTLLFVNGVDQGIHFLVPQINDGLLKSYFGHKDFVSYKFRSENSWESQVFYNEKLWKPTTSHDKLTMEEVGKHIDLDNLARHLFSFAFCGTTDFYQGIGVLDKSNPDNKLFWINWDMDHSFFDISVRSVNRELWEQNGWHLIYKQSHYKIGRTRLFSRLLNEDPAYRDFVISLSMDLMNHRINQKYLQERLKHYENMLVNYGQSDLRYIKKLNLFFKNRPAFLRDEMRDMFKLGPSFSCRVKGPLGIKYIIDDYPEDTDYQGYYFEGNKITVRIASYHNESFSHWLVNGKEIENFSLSFTVLSNSIIEPVFENYE